MHQTDHTDYHSIHIQELRKLLNFNSHKLYNNPYSSDCSKKRNG